MCETNNTLATLIGLSPLIIIMFGAAITFVLCLRSAMKG